MLDVRVELLDPRLTAWGFPRWGSEGAAGLDLHACLDAPLRIEPQAPAVLVPAGFVLRIADRGWCGLIHPRSGAGHRRGLVLGNGTGVIDADYAGPILISVWNRNPAGSDAAPLVVEPGERIAQIVFTRIVRPRITLVDVAGDSVPAPEPSAPNVRGAGGFGSTGRG